MDAPALPVRSYTPKSPDGPFPYTTTDLTPSDPGNDSQFYLPPRFVTHIDDNAISNLGSYYDANLPREGSILDFCSSWISHYPERIADAVKKGKMSVFGTGMNEAELRANPILGAFSVQDLNLDPEVKIPTAPTSNSTSTAEPVLLDASTCVVSIDYLTRPVDVLTGIRNQTRPNGKIHLAISNRCFPTKAVGRWLRVGEEERLEMVGDYLWWAGWRDIEIVTVVQASFFKDPLWVVRGVNTQAQT